MHASDAVVEVGSKQFHWMPQPNNQLQFRGMILEVLEPKRTGDGLRTLDAYFYDVSYSGGCREGFLQVPLHLGETTLRADCTYFVRGDDRLVVAFEGIEETRRARLGISSN